MDNIPAPLGPEHPYFNALIDMFPDICPNYLRKLCLGKAEDNEEIFEQLTLELTTGNYKRVATKLTATDKNEIINKHKMFVSLFPEADPEYLYEEIKLNFRYPNKLDDFVLGMMEGSTYPSKADYIKNQEIIAQETKYIKNFDLKYFLGEIPDPNDYFENSNRNVSYTDKYDYFYAVSLLQKKYSSVHIKDIIKIFDEQNCSVIKAAKILDTKQPKDSNFIENSKVKCKNISLLQELAYVLNKEDITDFINIQNERRLRAVKIAETAGLVYTCECCYGENFTDYDLVGCPIGHNFCKECVKKSCEVIIGDGKIEFPCLSDCGHQFRLNKLKDALPSKLFEKIDQRKQLEEVKQAKIDDLVYCPFCDYVTILPPNNNILQCLNEDCGKETCKLCKQISHVPLRCEEVEKKETNMRTFIEERMTEALVRTCPKCKKSFLKESGCNKMTCSCGTLMCYVCKIEITGYQHFKSYGGKTCPLYSDINTLHRESVMNGARRAKQELGNVQLKFDPSENI